MAMTAQPGQAHQPIREEERVLGITYDHAIRMVPELVRKTTGTKPEELGDGYFVSKVTADGRTREVTVRLGRQGPDTRFAVRIESYSVTKYFVIFTAVAIATMGIGVLFALPWLARVQRTEARARDLLSHKIFRALEDAVAEQGASPSYRIGPGVGAPNVMEEAPTEEASVAHLLK